MTKENGTKVVPSAESTTSVRKEEDAPISKAMAEKEEKLLKTRAKEEDSQRGKLPSDSSDLNDLQFSKLDELLTQAQLYSEFLLEKMEDITLIGVKENEEQLNTESKEEKGTKRKACATYNDKAKRAVATMLTRSQEGTSIEDAELAEEERVAKEQSELIPLLTGGKLKPYQIKGVKWLISLWQNGLNGILVDQLGLGKTIQTIGFLAHLKGKGLDGPYMVITPLSTLSNWVDDISRFVPSMKAIIYYGDRKERDDMRLKYMPETIGPQFPIIVTSYEVALTDFRRDLRHYKWKYVVADKAHLLKNANCKLLKALKMLPIENKLLLTGTPLQNNLAELYSLFNFILPDIFSSHQEFESWFDLSGKCSNEDVKEQMEEKRRVQVVAKLRAIMRSFILQRMKSDVEQRLPDKKEINLYATMIGQLDHRTNRPLENHHLDHGNNRALENHLQETVCGGCRKKLKMSMNRQEKNSLASNSTKKWGYVTWNSKMDEILASTLIEQIRKGNKGDQDFKPQAYQAVVNKVKSKMSIQLTADDAKNRFKVWKKHHGMITYIRTYTNFKWNDERKMVVINSDDFYLWQDFCKKNPQAFGYANKRIENWDDICALVAANRAIDDGLELHEESVTAMEIENEAGDASETFRRVVQQKVEEGLSHRSGQQFC